MMRLKIFSTAEGLDIPDDAALEVCHVLSRVGFLFYGCSALKTCQFISIDFKVVYDVAYAIVVLLILLYDLLFGPVLASVGRSVDPKKDGLDCGLRN